MRGEQAKCHDKLALGVVGVCVPQEDGDLSWEGDCSVQAILPLGEGKCRWLISCPLSYRKLVASSAQAVVHSSFLWMAHGGDWELSPYAIWKTCFKFLSNNLNLPEAKCRSSELCDFLFIKVPCFVLSPSSLQINREWWTWNNCALGNGKQEK